MNIVLAGGSGFIGRALRKSLAEGGHHVTLLTRRVRAEKGAMLWDGRSPGPWMDAVAAADAVVNLSGAGIADRRWTASRKGELLESRLSSTRVLVEALSRPGARARTLINASAVGYYGDVADGDVTESAPRGTGFLADVCSAWEAEALKAEKPGVRVVLLRIGIVLGEGGGALGKMALPFKLFVGGPVGSGRQWFPWVHVDDVAGAVLHALNTPSLNGPVNMTAPAPLTNRDFSAALGKALHRPSWAPAPGFALKIVLGEMAEMLLGGQKALPAKLLASGYRFKYPSADEALKAVFG